MHVVRADISTDYIYIMAEKISRITSMHLSAILPYNTLYLYFVQNTAWYSISYTLCELLRYGITHIILKYSPKGEGFHPSHVLEINFAVDRIQNQILGHCPRFWGNRDTRFAGVYAISSISQKKKLLFQINRYGIRLSTFAI